MTKEKKTYTTAFKKDAVGLITEQGYKTTVAARNLGIHPNPDQPEPKLDIRKVLNTLVGPGQRLVL